MRAGEGAFKRKGLAPGFDVDLGSFDPESWSELMTAFRDANLYQTWSYDRIRQRHPVVPMVVRQEGTVVAAAQVRILRLPGTQVGIAYARWGPMWRRRGVPDNVDVFRQAIRALRREFSLGRGLVLRLYPLAHRGVDDELASILEEEGYRLHDIQTRDRTLVLDLQPSLDELRASLDQKWRNSLNKAERSGLELRATEDESLFDALAEMHSQMLARKGPVEVNDLAYLRMIQRDLPRAQKLKVVLCLERGEPCAGAVFTTLGDTGVYIRGATSNVGLKTNGSYLVQWAFVRWLKENAFDHYDLHGINPDANPGTYFFKRGLAGRRGRDIEFLGRYQVADSPVCHWLVTSGERLLSGCRKLMSRARWVHAGVSRHGKH